MPQIEWSEESRKRVLLFLPAAGLPVGCAEALWLLLFAVLHVGSPAWLYALAACIIPIFLTGAIHLDGLADSADALASWGSAEKKRTILKDPHIGTFGVIALILYILCMIVLMHTLFERVCMPDSESAGFWRPALLLGSLFILSRALTQLAIAWVSPSVEEGMLYQFSSRTGRKALGLSGFLLILSGQILWFWAGGLPALLLMPGMALHLVLFRRKMLRSFGGLSGDLCGRLIQLSELWMTALLCWIV